MAKKALVLKKKTNAGKTVKLVFKSNPKKTRGSKYV